MPRLMSVRHTEPAVRARIKTETRRAGWTWLQPGTPLTLVRQAMGLRKGETITRICEVLVTAVRREPLSAITDEGVAAEGFRGWTPTEFVAFFIDHMGGAPDQEVTVITWDYL